MMPSCNSNSRRGRLLATAFAAITFGGLNANTQIGPITWTLVGLHVGEVDYTYDNRNRLTTVRFKNNSGSVTQTVSYKYDPLDRLPGSLSLGHYCRVTASIK
jgi:YD repeat-containing protein